MMLTVNFDYPHLTLFYYDPILLKIVILYVIVI